MGNIGTIVSVVVPIYNGEKFVDTLISNFTKQSFKNFEVVIVNDGSTDSTKEILESYKENKFDFSLTIIHQKNAGVSAARNTGINNAKGKYLCFVDADDVISSDYLEILYNAINFGNSGIAVAYMSRKLSDLQNRDQVKIQQITSTEFLRDFLYRGIKYTVCACMFDKKCFVERGVYFPEGFKYSEDVYVLWQLFAAEKNITVVNCSVYHYYDNPQSAMNKGMDIARLDAIRLMQKLEKILPNLNSEFAPEFIKYAVARHHWSILWQAAIKLNNYKEFNEYCKNFEMKKELKKMLSYPQPKLSLSSLIYTISPLLYYHLIRLFVGLTRK